MTDCKRSHLLYIWKCKKRIRLCFCFWEMRERKKNGRVVFCECQVRASAIDGHKFADLVSQRLDSTKTQLFVSPENDYYLLAIFMHFTEHFEMLHWISYCSSLEIAAAAAVNKQTKMGFILSKIARVHTKKPLKSLHQDIIYACKCLEFCAYGLFSLHVRKSY